MIVVLMSLMVKEGDKERAIIITKRRNEDEKWPQCAPGQKATSKRIIGNHRHMRASR